MDFLNSTISLLSSVCCLTIQCGCLKAGLLPQESHLAMSAPWLLTLPLLPEPQASSQAPKKMTRGLLWGLFPPTTICCFYCGNFDVFLSFFVLTYVYGCTHTTTQAPHPTLVTHCHKSRNISNFTVSI